ncbi:MAG TPA: methionyl-tRNA formyltransferase [Acidimicrobiales bacterium]|nr:methionyl-tRNA formyltransferase [Acidimicrobiales bacterium]
MRLVFLGSPAAAVPPLRALVAAGHDLALVVTRADKRRGRGGALLPTPVKEAAAELGVAVTDQVDDVLGAGAELGVVVAFGRLIKPHVLDVLPMVNIHFSLLPRWRGAAPVERAVLAGDAETGVCLMALEEGLDTGPVYRRAVVPIGEDETAAELRARLVEVGTTMLVGALAEGLGEGVPQEGEPTYASKIGPDELVLDWSRPAAELERVVRVGGAWTTNKGRRLKVLRACAHRVSGAGVVHPTGDGPLELLEVQPEGRGPMPAADWARGARWRDGDRLGS